MNKRLSAFLIVMGTGLIITAFSAKIGGGFLIGAGFSLITYKKLNIIKFN